MAGTETKKNDGNVAAKSSKGKNFHLGLDQQPITHLEQSIQTKENPPPANETSRQPVSRGKSAAPARPAPPNSDSLKPPAPKSK